MADAASTLEDEGMVLELSRRVRSSWMFPALNSPDTTHRPVSVYKKHFRLDYLIKGSEVDVLGLRSVTTTLHRSNTSLSFLSSMSRSVVPDTVPVGMMTSFTAS